MKKLPKWSIFSKYADNPINKLKLKAWYFKNYTIQPKEIFVRKLNRKLPGWLLAEFKDENGEIVFALTPTWGPLFVGDEMGINDPIVPIDYYDSTDDIVNAHYGFNGGLSSGDGKKYLPSDPQQWKEIWNKAIATHKVINGVQHQEYCPDCKGEYSFGTSLTKKGHLCPTCFGLRTIYKYGPQKKFGQILLENSDITIQDRRNSIKFKPAGLKALIDLYNTYHTGIVTDIAQSFLVRHCHSVLCQVFPDEVIYKTEDHTPEDGWSDSFYSADGVFTYRHLYAKKGEEYVNLFSGKVETPSHTPVLANLPDDIPGRFRWNLCIDLLYNLCVLDTAE